MKGAGVLGLLESRWLVSDPLLEIVRRLCICEAVEGPGWWLTLSFVSGLSGFKDGFLVKEIGLCSGSPSYPSFAYDHSSAKSITIFLNLIHLAYKFLKN